LKRADLFLFSGTGIPAWRRCVPIRKPKKLPAKTSSVCYRREYGTDTIEIPEDAVNNGEPRHQCESCWLPAGPHRTGNAIQQLAKVEARRLAVELTFLNGRSQLAESMPFRSFRTTINLRLPHNLCFFLCDAADGWLQRAPLQRYGTFEIHGSVVEERQNRTFAGTFGSPWTSPPSTIPIATWSPHPCKLSSPSSSRPIEPIACLF